MSISLIESSLLSPSDICSSSGEPAYPTIDRQSHGHSYLIHKGGTTSKDLSNLAVEIWEWCLQRNLTIHAEHILQKLNSLADSDGTWTPATGDWI